MCEHRPPTRYIRSLPRWTLLSIAVVLWSLGPAPALAQDDLQAQRQATERRLQSLKEQIRQDQERLAEAAQAEEASQKTLDNIRREIALREELVATYQQRLRQLQAEREALRDTLGQLQGRLGDLRSEYRARAVHAYKHGRLHDLALIMAARSINQMLIRIRYLRRFAAQRRTQRSEIQQAQTALQSRRQALEESRARTRTLLAEAQSERDNLESLQAERRRVISELRAKRSELREEIEKKQSAARELENRIRALVAASESGSEGTTGSGEAASATYANLSASFEENRGRLPWPAEGAVTESFGNRVDPVYGTTTYHPGILIATNPESEVHCVFDGVVTGIDFVPGYGTYLVIRHGNYLSVYSNFSSLSVATGDYVTAGQVLGRAGTANEPRGAGVFFAIFDKTENKSVDPMPWLTAR